MSTSTTPRRDPRRRRAPFDVPSERSTLLDLGTTAAVTVMALATVLIVWFSGSATDSGTSPAGSDQPTFGAARVVPSSFQLMFNSPSADTGAPLVTRGNLVTVEAGRVVGRAAGTGEVQWTYEHPDALCGAAFYSDRLATQWQGDDGCSDVTMINPTTGDYAATRQSGMPEGTTLRHVWDYALAFSPTRVEMWRNDLVRTVEYGAVKAPQESGQQPRWGCTMRSVAVGGDRFAVAERCPGEASDRLTISKNVPKDSRKPEEYGSDVTGADELHLIDIVDDGVLALRKQDGAWSVQLYTSGGHSKTIVDYRGTPRLAPTDQTLAPGINTTRWFDGQTVFGFDRATGGVKWKTAATGPGVELGYGVGAPDQAQPDPYTLVPTETGVAVISSEDGRVQREFPVAEFRESEDAVRQAAQIGDMIYLRIGGKIYAYKAA